MKQINIYKSTQIRNGARQQSHSRRLSAAKKNRKKHILKTKRTNHSTKIDCRNKKKKSFSITQKKTVKMDKIRKIPWKTTTSNKKS